MTDHTRLPLPPLPTVFEWPLSPDALRARDIEVVRCVLEAAARIAEKHFHSTTAKQIRAALEKP